MYAEWRVWLIFLKPSFSMWHGDNASMTKSCLRCLLTPASFTFTGGDVSRGFHVAWASPREHSIPLWPIIPHKEQGDASTCFYKAFTSPLSSVGMLFSPPASLSSHPAWPARASQASACCVRPEASICFCPSLCWLWTASPAVVLHGQHQQSSGLFSPTLLPHTLHLTLHL